MEEPYIGRKRSWYETIDKENLPPNDSVESGLSSHSPGQPNKHLKCPNQQSAWHSHCNATAPPTKHTTTRYPTKHANQYSYSYLEGLRRQNRADLDDRPPDPRAKFCPQHPWAIEMQRAHQRNLMASRLVAARRSEQQQQQQHRHINHPDRLDGVGDVSAKAAFSDFDQGRVDRTDPASGDFQGALSGRPETRTVDINSMQSREIVLPSASVKSGDGEDRLDIAPPPPPRTRKRKRVVGKPIKFQAPPGPINAGVEDVQLVFSEDSLLTTSYSHFVMSLLKKCYSTRGGGRNGCPLGFPGLVCQFCAGKPGERRFFFSCHEALLNNMAHIPAHFNECQYVPKEVLGQLAQLKTMRSSQKLSLKKGDNQIFISRVWDRLHEIFESSDEESLDNEKVQAANEPQRENEEEEEEEEQSPRNDESDLSLREEELSLGGDLDEAILCDPGLDLASLLGMDHCQLPSFEGLLD